MPQWFRRLGGTAPALPTPLVIDVTPARTWREALAGQQRKVTKEVAIEGSSVVETITIAPMTADELKRELAAWRTKDREEQWRRIR